MKEDVLEQIVDDYLQFKGYFTTHNVRFRPRTDHPMYNSQQDSVYSDVDVVGYHPLLTGVDRVLVVTCKAWQAGFDATSKLGELRGEKSNPKRATWRHFRELGFDGTVHALPQTPVESLAPKWTDAFRSAIHKLTGESSFSYRIAVTHLRGDAAAWATDPTITSNLLGCSIGFLTLEEMWATMLAELTTTPAASEIGRLAQLLKAAGLTAPTMIAAPSAPRPGSDAALQEDIENDER